MNGRKITLRYFSIMDYETEQEYLGRMHAEGWRFTGITFPVIYHFERCVPEKVIYQLDYNQEGIAHKEEYVQMFRDCGWEYTVLMSSSSVPGTAIRQCSILMICSPTI